MARHNSSTAQHAATSPLTLNITRLGRRPGSMFEWHQTVPSPTRIGVELVAIPPGAPLDVHLRVESVSEGVLVTGAVRAPTTGECARCLSPVTSDVEVHLTELFAYPDSITKATTEEDEVGRVVDNTVNIEQPIVDAVGLELPFAPLCGPDCPGLCPDCGVQLATAEPRHHHEQIDPRWAKLAGMLVDSGSEDDNGPGIRR